MISAGAPAHHSTWRELPDSVTIGTAIPRTVLRRRGDQERSSVAQDGPGTGSSASTSEASTSVAGSLKRHARGFVDAVSLPSASSGAIVVQRG
jgi:hypothetical protein